MLRLYITRHGETEWNKQKKIQGWSESDLTEIGRENALSLGRRLKDVQFDAIYSSPSIRTVETTKLIRGLNETPVILDQQLKEMNMGDWEGKTHTYIEENDPKAFHDFWNNPHLYQSVNGESFHKLNDRVTGMMKKIIYQFNEGNLLIVTHSVVIKSMYAFMKNIPLERIWEPPYIHDTSLTIAEWQHNSFQIVLEGDLSHRVKNG